MPKTKDQIYSESSKILDEVKKANRVLVNCHRSPDPDSVGSAISMQLALKSLGKDVTIISPDDIPGNCKFLEIADKIEIVNFGEFDFSNHDLFITLDSGNWNQITGHENIIQSGIKTLVIDHHYTNPKEGFINLVDIKAGSCCAVIFNILDDWKISLTPLLAEALLTGIIADTASFQTDVIGERAFGIAEKLVEAGADRRKILFNLFMSRSLDEVHLMGEMLSNMQVDEAGFAWVAVPLEISKKFPKSEDAKTFVAGNFAQSLEGTKFGFVAEEKEDFTSVSFRSRKDFDVSKIAENLGGGGHKSASAARLYMPFDQAVIKILETSRKYAEKNN